MYMWYKSVLCLNDITKSTTLGWFHDENRVFFFLCNLHRKYENRNLAQMETVYPKSYIFRQEKNIPGVYDRKTYESYQLTVECNVCEDGSEKGEGEEMKADKSNAILNSSALLRRRKVFNKNLGEITRRHHKVPFGPRPILCVCVCVSMNCTY